MIEKNKPNPTNLDSYFIETTERYYNRLVNIYKKRIAKANDKEYTHQEFSKYCEALLEIRFRASEREVIVTALEHENKIGKEFQFAIKTLRKSFKNREHDSVGDFIEINDRDEDSEIEGFSKGETQGSFNINQYSDLELVRMFSEYKAYQHFRKFLKEENQSLPKETPIKEATIAPDILEKSKDFTTARQVLAIHYLLKYSHVKNVDRTEIARFIQFLTGKNYDNIYKKLQNPFKVNDKALKEDLRFVREYFERLSMLEIVKLINNEISA